ncbi:MAG: choice-of-anchor F family protein, partial [Thiovulaceae bacterium]|nr:choice-of-anchor F family protein [Sulfurimonadaceae bacterium]
MKNVNTKKILRLSVVAAMMVGAGLNAGQIVTDAAYSNTTETDLSQSAVVTANKQFGLTGWNLDNVTVKITDLAFVENTGKVFYPSDGTYNSMAVGDSFETEIYDRNGSGEVRGKLHGKSWPIGEPSGIKVVNGDTLAAQGRPFNCIMGTSYLDGFYLDSATPKPVICSSEFQTHKRFKVNLQPSTITTIDSVTGYGKPYEIAFNLDPADTSTQRYEVLQKINNYTGGRLDGYKIEVLDENGSKNANLTLSLGIGEKTDGGDIWDIEDTSTFSHGLWGPADKHFATDGFFDALRMYYPVALSDNNQTISYHGTMSGGNYQDLFGSWLPSKWAPTGIFYDFDNDPATDADLVAFWGDPEQTGTDGWHKGNADGWATPTAAELLAWNGPLYSLDKVEDTLNLGLNYIVNIGDNTKIGNKVIIRITPHKLPGTDAAPTYVGDAIAIDTTYTSSVGTVSIVPAPTFTIGDHLTVAVADTDLNTNVSAVDYTTVTVTTSKGESEAVTLTETGIDTSIFTGILGTEFGDAFDDDNRVISVTPYTKVTVNYTDADSGTVASAVNVPHA